MYLLEKRARQDQNELSSCAICPSRDIHRLHQARGLCAGAMEFGFWAQAAPQDRRIRRKPGVNDRNYRASGCQETVEKMSDWESDEQPWNLLSSAEGNQERL